MRDAMVRIERWLAAHAPKVLANLRAPATDADLDAWAAATGRPVPEDLASWYRVHDGQRANRAGVLCGWEWHAAREAIDVWRRCARFAVELPEESPRAIRPGWFRTGWTPFAGNGAGDCLCLDLDPGTLGTVGQIVEFVHDAPTRAVIAPSLTAWLDGCAAAYEQGRWRLGEFDLEPA